MASLNQACLGMKHLVSKSKLACRNGFNIRRLKSSNSSGNDSSAFKPQELSNTTLSQPLEGFPKPLFATVTREDHETKVTTLSNGLRVASQKKFGQFCTVGVVIDSGSRHEVAYPSGIAHFLEKLAFNSTVEYKDKDAIMSELEMYGGICDAQGSRDTFIYAASIHSRGLEAVVRMLSEVVLRPKITEEELAISRQIVHYELEDINMKPDQEPLLFEQIHAAAFKGNTLGLPKLCPIENVPVIDRKILFTYIKNYHTPSRMVLAGVGIEHEQLLDCARKYFEEKKPIWEEDPSLAIKGVNEVDQSLAQYTGGILAISKDLSNISLGPTPMPELVHFVLGLETCSHTNLDDFIPLCVLNMMMGGGGSFSAGGPGKGMYTRLYTNVLNRYHWIHDATAYNHAYSDTGLFCIHASSPPAQITELINIIIKETIDMAGSICDIEFNRAKTQLKSMLLMNLEARPVMFEDIGRQVLANGHRKPPHFWIEQIDKVTQNDIRRVATKMIKSKASVAVLGNVKDVPPLEDIETALISKDGRIPKRFTLFR